MKKGDVYDPKGLIFEAYNIDGITLSECRSIFLDWALSLGESADTFAALSELLAKYTPKYENHPMTAVLREGQTRRVQPRRRGGWRSRTRPN